MKNTKVDWGQLEVFAKSGNISYSEHFCFLPGITRGEYLFFYKMVEIKLVSMDFTEISKIWKEY